jgi:copper homeostasis protein (lipoprotein)
MRPAPDAALVVEIEGLVAQRPRVQGGGTETSVIVERIRRVSPKDACAARYSGAPLTDTYWRLTHLGDRVVPAATDPRREPSLTFMSQSNSFSGSSGCNRLVGTYAVTNASMTLTSGGTMVACKDLAKTESALMTALQATRTYRIVGRVLELIDAKGARLARFEARVPAGITVR